MIVGFNLLFLLPGISGGTETYAAHLIRAIAQLGRGLTLKAFVNRASLDWPLPQNVERIVCGVAGPSRERRYAYEQLLLPRVVRAHRVDVLHSMGYVGPVFPGVRHVVTIPDANFTSPEHAMRRARRVGLRAFVRMAASRCDHILTLSDFSRRELLGALDVPAAKITRVYCAPRDGAGASRDADVLRRHSVTQPYVVAFSSGSPHKNIRRLTEAFPARGNGTGHRLVVVGHPPEDLADYPPAARREVVWTGYVPDADVLPLIAGADLLAVPSLYEGFGLPLLDAQAAGTPVACADAGALPEIANGSARLFDGRSVASIRDALSALLPDASARAELAAAGRRNAARFSWRTAAEATVEEY